MNQSELAEIQAIVAELQETIRRQTLSGGPGENAYADPLADVVRHQRVNSHLPIGWPLMPKGISRKLVAYAKKVVRRLLRWYIDPIVDQQNTYNAAVARALQRLSRRSRVREKELGSRLTQLQRTRDTWIQDLVRQVGELRAGLEESQSELATSAMRLRRLEHWRRQETPPDLSAQRSSTPSEVSPEIDYFLLGALYRNERQMAPFLNDYDDVFAQLYQDQRDGKGPQGPVLDIGCGRGEFVAHLNEMGLSAYGIDMDIDAVEMGQAAERRVTKAEAFAHLPDLADNSLAAVTLIQVIEHFEFPDLIRLFRLAHQKLREGGFIVAETINPTCLFALSNWYLLDPSHRTPLHPQMTEFLLEQAEFEQVSIRFLHPIPEAGKLVPLSTAGGASDLRSLLDRLNDNIRRLNDFLYADQDYAAIAYKASEVFHLGDRRRSEEG